MAPPVIPGLSIPAITGPVCLGFMLSYMLYGMLIVQIYQYHGRFADDPMYLKTFVWFVFFLETLYSVFMGIAAWNQFGIGWGDTATLAAFDWTWLPMGLLSGIISMLIQSFYIWRFYQSTKNIIVSLFIESISILQGVTSCYYPAKDFAEGRTVVALEAIATIVDLALISTTVCDVLIAIAMVISLHRINQRVQFKRTKHLIRRTIRFTVETGLVTAVCATVMVVIWLASRTTNYWLIFFLVLAKLYSNALLAALNARPTSNGEEKAARSTVSASGFWDDHGTRSFGNSAAPTSVHISRSTRTKTDGSVVHEMVNFPKPDKGYDGVIDIEQGPKAAVQF